MITKLCNKGIYNLLIAILNQAVYDKNNYGINTWDKISAVNYDEALNLLDFDAKYYLKTINSLKVVIDGSADTLYTRRVSD